MGTPDPVELDLQVPSGRLHAQRFGPTTAALVVCVPGYGYIVPAADRDRFAREVPAAQIVDVDANHYGIITAEAAASAIADFLRALQ